ncbi:penicillin-binding protein 2 [Nocardioides zeae]|uniref:Penicillin-binding protein 2 n=1 Tax=Nocardioides imazamoxiresistens TaxID=3231893 RepID=A0ABU3PWB3_9ACTN|nr:penicillin-binding protein 2 [Nocardioides zeae]MDT9593040.1 penicillin-binding protein 2 [Nocardioides zeae]
MNKPIRTVSVFCLILFVALLAQATNVQFFQAGGYYDRADNRRVLETRFAAERGSILAGDLEVAVSEPVDDRYQYQRTYPYPQQYAHLTGWFYYGNQTRLERSQNSLLSGDDPSLFINQLSDLIDNRTPAGSDVRLTIDPGVQQVAYEQLSALAGGGDVQGAVVALRPTTGEVLASVSLPSYNPNDLALRDVGQVQENYEILDTAEARPLTNRATETTLPPGSTFKLVTAAAYLEDNPDITADSQVPGGDSYQLPGTRTSIANGGRACGDSTVSLTQAMENSCNTTFLQLAVDVGQEDMTRTAEAFGFNETPIEDYPGAVASAYPDNEGDDALAVSGIGQRDVRATPLEMAMVVGAIANDGVLMQPYLIDQVRSPNGDVVERTDPEEIGEATSPRTAEVLQDLLVNTVNDGTASQARIEGVTVGGKTGTAENCEDCRPYAWFVSFAERDGEQVAVAVMLQNVPENVTISGGGLGGPIARAVMAEALGVGD